jgi:uncharacterized protein
MKIGIISDIHGYSKSFKNALVYLQGCDIILCAGDILYHGPRNPVLEGYNPKELLEVIKENNIPMLIARGNCDAEVDLMVLNKPIINEYIFYEKEGVRFIVTHGHDLSEDRLREIGSYYNASIVVTGHTHIRKYENYNGIEYINPGSVSLPRGDEIPSIAIYENNEINFIDINTGEIIDIKK